ncbi:MAG: amino acid transporter [Pseudomonadota bacterium]|nr:amino acid transporter [Pseudomonadota bacterium]
MAKKLVGRKALPLIQNERHKLTANALNGVAIATMVAGSVAPLIAASYGFSGAPADRFLAFVTAGWFLAGIAIHIVARLVLGGLKE